MIDLNSARKYLADMLTSSETAGKSTVDTFFSQDTSAREEYAADCDRRNRRNAVIFLYILIVSQVIVGTGRLAADLGFPYYNVGVIFGSLFLLGLLRVKQVARHIRQITLALFSSWAATFPLFIVRLGGYDSPTYPIYILIIIYILAFFYLTFAEYVFLYVIIFLSNLAIVLIQPDVDGASFMYRQIVMLMVMGVAMVASFLQVKARRQDFYNQYQLGHQKSMLEKAYQKLESAELQLVQQEKMASLGKMTSGMAHEINNPLGFIVGNLEMMEEDIAGIGIAVESLSKKLAETEEGRQVLQSVLGNLHPAEDLRDLSKSIEGCKHGTARIASIVDGLKHFSRLDEAESKPTNIADCLESALAMIPDIQKISVERKYEVDVRIEGFPALLGQLFFALLENACQAMADSGQKTLSLSIRAQDEIIEVQIGDTGCGIPADDQTKIFDPFFTTKEVGKGTGLGLSLAYGIAAQHGGLLKLVKSDADGTTMLVSLPRKAPPARNR